MSLRGPAALGFERQALPHLGAPFSPGCPVLVQTVQMTAASPTLNRDTPFPTGDLRGVALSQRGNHPVDVLGHLKACGCSTWS